MINEAEQRVRRQARRALGAGAVAGLAGLALAPVMGHAAEAVVEQATELSGVNVDGEGRQRPVSPKYTATLQDTPQTITVVSSEAISAQNLLSLREILQTQPGITFGAGEGGGGYGDSINLRGYSANSDITVDGVRDSAQYTRSDPFNLEQIEIINGANSVYAGAGSVGGSINIVSKTPRATDATVLSAGAGTDSYGRLTLDANKVLTDTVAVRLNAMVHSNDVPGRDVENSKRWGIAPSVAFGLGTPTRFSVALLAQRDKNIPQYGVPYYVNAFHNGPLPGVDPSNYYGYSNVDKQQINVDSATLTFDHDFSETLSVRNLTRYQEVSQFAALNPPQGTWCLATSLTPANVACANPGFYQPSGPRGTTRDSVNKTLYNQTDLTARFATGAINHTLVVGASFMTEDYHLDNGNSLRNPGGATPNPVLPPMNIANPDNIYTGPVNFVVTGRSDGERVNKAVYLFDTAQISEKLDFNFGLRLENTDGKFTSTSIATPYPATGPVATVSPTLSNTENLFSYRAGLVFKPTPEASLYVAYGNSQTPSQQTVNGGCSAATCNVDPEEGRNIEIGAKYQAFGGRLFLTAALFRNERTNYKVASGDPTLPDQVLDGKSRVDGLALGASGEVLPGWSVFANYTYLDSEVIQSVSDYTRQTTGIDAQAGNPLTNTPRHSGSLWTTYTLPAGVTLGYGATYQGRFYLNNGVAPLYRSDDYWMHSLMASYPVTDQVNVQLNLKNLTDEEYYIRGRNNGWATPGEGRSLILSATYAF